MLSEAFGATARTYGYDSAGRLNLFDQTGTGITRTSALGYNDSGRVKKEVTNSVTRNFTYDAAGQVTATSGVEGPRAYTYDQLGRRTTETVGAQTSTFTYNAASELLARTVTAGGGQSTAYTYDLSGRRVTETMGSNTKQLRYDTLGRLSETVESGTVRAFGYNAGGLVERVVSTGTKQGASWIDWDDTDSLVGINTPEIGYSTYTGNNGVWGVRSVGSNVVGVGVDWMGSVLATGPGGNQATASTYDVYGRQVGTPGTGIGATGVSVGYRGEVTVDNHVLLRARVYAPNTGQFLTKDPVAGRPGFTTLTNPYHYADNDPIGRYDPSGMVSLPSPGDIFNAGKAAVGTVVDAGGTAVGMVVDGAGAVVDGVRTVIDHRHIIAKKVTNWIQDNVSKIAVAAAVIVGAACMLFSGGSAVVLCAGLAHSVYGATHTIVENCVGTTRSQCAQGVVKAVAIDIAFTVVGGAAFKAAKVVGRIASPLIKQVGPVFKPLQTLVQRLPTPTNLRAVFTNRMAQQNQSGAIRLPGGNPHTPGAPKVVVVGRNMDDRVLPYVAKHGYDYYKGTPTIIPRSLDRVAPNMLRRIDLWFNKRWINSQMRQGKRIIDIGEPEGYQPSVFYEMERIQLDGYWNYVQDPQP